MATQINPAARYSRRRAARPVSDINVTPMVDVMLVLLVVFMVTAPLMTVAVPVDLPKTQAHTLSQDKEPLVVSMDAEGRVYLQDKPLREDELVPKLKAVTGANPDARIFVRGDKNLAYGKIMEIMGAISSAGFTKVALVAEIPLPGPRIGAMRYVPTVNDDGLKNGLSLSAFLHLLLFLFLFFGLPHLIPPLPAHHEPVPFEIVTIADITNTHVEDQQPQPPPPAEPPKPQPAPPVQEKPQPPAPTPPQPKVEAQAEALKPIPKPQEKPKPVEQPKPQPDMLASVLKDVSKLKPTPQPTETKTETKNNAPAATAGPSLSSRLSITEEDALRRQIEQCWNPPIGARDAQNLVVEVTITVNQDRTVADADVVDKSRYASDPFFRAAADAAMRAVRNPKCSPLILPDDKYDQWKRIDFTFDPRDML